MDHFATKLDQIMGHLQTKYTRAYYLHKTDQGEPTPYGVAGIEEFKTGKLRPHDTAILKGVNFRGLRVADFGFGRGEALKFAHDHGADQLLGVDFSPDAKSIAERYLADYGIRAELFCDDAVSFARRISSQNNRDLFDVILMLDFVEHVPRSELTETLTLLRKVLSPRGIVVVNTPAFPVDNDVIQEGLKKDARDDSDDFDETSGMHCNRYTRSSLMHFMENLKLAPLTTHYYVPDFSFPRVLRSTPWIIEAASYAGYPLLAREMQWPEPVELAFVPKPLLNGRLRSLANLASRWNARAASYAWSFVRPEEHATTLAPVIVEDGPLKGGQILLAWDGTIAWQRSMRDGTFNQWLYEDRKDNPSWEGAVIWDIGGHIGYDTLSFARLVGPHGTVCTFEPNLFNLARLERNLALNPDLSERIKVFNFALGKGDERQTFRFSSNIDNGASSCSHLARFQPNEDRSTLASFQSTEVEVRTSDNLVSSNQAPPPHLVKLDVEGAEFEVLEGMKEILRTHRPHLAIEIHSVHAMFQTQQLLAQLNYHTHILNTAEDAPSRCFLWAHPIVPAMLPPNH